MLFNLHFVKMNISDSNHMNRLGNACHGLSHSKGGMNLNEFRRVLIHLHPDVELLQKAPRKELEQFCLQHMESESESESESEPEPESKPELKSGSQLKLT